MQRKSMRRENALMYIWVSRDGVHGLAFLLGWVITKEVGKNMVLWQASFTLVFEMSCENHHCTVAICTNIILLLY